MNVSNAGDNGAMANNGGNDSSKPGKRVEFSEGKRGSYIVVSSPSSRPMSPPQISAPAADKK
jgi:hypothetical protein